MLVGAGCGGAASSGPSASAAFTKAGITTFTAKDKTAAAATLLGADSAKLSSLTEYKFSDVPNLIVIVGEAKDANDVPRMGDTLGESMKAQAAAVTYEYSSLGGMKDAHWFGYVLEKDVSFDAKAKILGAISQ